MGSGHGASKSLKPPVMSALSTLSTLSAFAKTAGKASLAMLAILATFAGMPGKMSLSKVAKSKVAKKVKTASRSRPRRRRQYRLRGWFGPLAIGNAPRGVVLAGVTLTGGQCVVKIGSSDASAVVCGATCPA